MKRFNLLPESIINRQRLRKMFIGLSAAQVLILSVVICSFPVMRITFFNISQRSEELSRLTDSSSYLESDIIVDKITAINEIITARDDILATYKPVFFNGKWLDIVSKSIPYGVELTGFEFEDGQLTVTCRAADLILIDRQRQDLSKDGLSNSLVRITLNDEIYLYTLKMRAEV